MIGISPTKFDWNKLTTQSPTDLGGHSGTTTIRNKKFTNPSSGTQFGDNIVLVGGTGTVIIQGCYFGASYGIGIDVEDFNGTFIIENCLFANNRGGIFFGNCTLSNSRVRNNWCINPHGAATGKGQFLQLANGTSCPGLQITGNKLRGYWGEAYTEDWISAFGGTSGSSGNPFVYSKNFAQGCGVSFSNGGFMLGDTGGAWGVNEYNKVLDPGNYIYAIAGGQNNIVRNNLGYSTIAVNQQIACYMYETIDSGTCSNHTMQNNSVYTSSGNYYFGGSGGEICSSVTGISGGTSDGNFTPGNTTGLSFANLDFPTRLIDCVDEDTLWQIRKEISPYRRTSTGDPNLPVSPNWPTANSEADKSTSSTSTTINSTGSSGGTDYRWVFVKGPATPTLSNETTATLSVSNMTALGPYRFRLEYYDGTPGANTAAQADWTTITKT